MFFKEKSLVHRVLLTWLVITVKPLFTIYSKRSPLAPLVNAPVRSPTDNFVEFVQCVYKGWGGCGAENTCQASKEYTDGGG